MSDEDSSVKTDKSTPEYSAGQRYRMAAVYQMLASALPTEGRDYAVQFSFPNGADSEMISVKFEPYNELGKMWCEYCKRVLRERAGK